MERQIDIWSTVIAEKYPNINQAKKEMMFSLCANRHYLGEKDEFSNLFEQYLILRYLKSGYMIEDRDK